MGYQSPPVRRKYLVIKNFNDTEWYVLCHNKQGSLEWFYVAGLPYSEKEQAEKEAHRLNELRVQMGYP